MATRFYFPSTGTPSRSPTYSAEWEHNRDARFPLVTTAGSSALSDIAYEPDGADHLVDQDMLFGQFVSLPLTAQTIAAQTVTWQFQAAEGSIANNLFLTLKIFTISYAGVVKETVLAIQRDNTELTAVSVAITNRNDSATSTAVSTADGDCLVIEVGLGGLPTTGGRHGGTLRIGEDAASGDLPVNNTSVATDLRPWLELTNTLSFGTSYLLTESGDRLLLETGTDLLVLENYLVSAPAGTGAKESYTYRNRGHR